MLDFGLTYWMYFKKLGALISMLYKITFPSYMPLTLLYFLYTCIQHFTEVQSHKSMQCFIQHPKPESKDKPTEA